MSIRTLLALTVAVFAIISAPIALKAQDGLYEAPIPADKSLIRFINAKLTFDAQITLTDVDIAVEAEALSPYQIIDNGAYRLRFNDQEIGADFKAGAFYTIALDSGSKAEAPLVVIEDTPPENPSRSSLTFYNFSDGPASLSLQLKGDERALFEAVAPGSTATKELPAIELGLIVRAADRVIMEAPAVTFTSDLHHNVVVLSNTGETVGYMTTTEIAK